MCINYKIKYDGYNYKQKVNKTGLLLLLLLLLFLCCCWALMSILLLAKIRIVGISILNELDQIRNLFDYLQSGVFVFSMDSRYIL